MKRNPFKRKPKVPKLIPCAEPFDIYMGHKEDDSSFDVRIGFICGREHGHIANHMANGIVATTDTRKTFTLSWN